MKIRNGFVSNSSSSSFILVKNEISKQQLEKIINHESECDKYGYEEGDFWDITINDEMVIGNTSMDDFDMYSFLIDLNIDCKFGYEFEFDNVKTIDDLQSILR